MRHACDSASDGAGTGFAAVAFTDADGTCTKAAPSPQRGTRTIVPYAYVVTSHSRAEPAALFTLLRRAGTWPSWSPIDSAEIEGGGNADGQQQVGDTSVFHTGRALSRERIVELVTDRRFTYENAGGPFRSYRSTVELLEAPHGGTQITWSATFEPKLPLSGRFWQWLLTRFMQRMADGLAAHASRLHHTEG